MHSQPALRPQYGLSSQQRPAVPQSNQAQQQPAARSASGNAPPRQDALQQAARQQQPQAQHQSVAGTAGSGTLPSQDASWQANPPPPPPLSRSPPSSPQQQQRHQEMALAAQQHQAASQQHMQQHREQVFCMQSKGMTRVTSDAQQLTLPCRFVLCSAVVKQLSSHCWGGNVCACVSTALKHFVDAAVHPAAGCKGPHHAKPAGAAAGVCTK
jgi:hypothetical protein